MSDARTSKNVPLNAEERAKLVKAAAIESLKLHSTVTPTALLRSVGMVGVDMILDEAKMEQ